MQDPHIPSRRAAYRVSYPIRERPAFVIGDEAYVVLDCAELGMRFEGTPGKLPDVGDMIGGRVRFRRGAEVIVSGEVMRVEGPIVALRFYGQGIPFGEMISEQHYLRSMGYTLLEGEG